MQKISAMPAAPKDQVTQPTVLRLVETEAKTPVRRNEVDPKPSLDEVEDMWDNMPV